MLERESSISERNENTPVAITTDGRPDSSFQPGGILGLFPFNKERGPCFSFCKFVTPSVALSRLIKEIPELRIAQSGEITDIKLMRGC